MDEYPYKLVVFPEDKAQLISIEIVPSHWIVWNEVEKILECYYMSGSLWNKKRKDLQSLVKEGAPPNTQWPKYEVEIRGRAKSYKDAEIGLEKLETKQYAYSTDDEIACQKKMLQEKKFYQMKKSPIDIPIIEESLNFHVDLIGNEKENAIENVGIYKKGLDKNSAKNLYNKKYEKKRKYLSQRSEKNKMSTQHSLPFDSLCDSNNSSDESIKSTIQHKIKTTGKGSKHSSSQRLSNHSSKPRRESRRSSSTEHLSSPDENGTINGNTNLLKLKENDRRSFILKSLTFSSKERNLSNKNRDTYLERYLSLPSFHDVTESKRENEKNETNNPNVEKHSYSSLHNINKNDISRPFNSSRRIYNSKFSDSRQLSNSYQTNDKESVDGNYSSSSRKQYKKTQNLKNVPSSINSRKFLSSSCNEILTDSISSSSSLHSYKSQGYSSRGNERDNIYKKLHKDNLPRNKPQNTITSQSTGKTDSLSLQSSRKKSSLCTIYEHEMNEFEQSSLKETVLKCHDSVSKQISDLKGFVIDCKIKLKNLQSKMENTPFQAMEALNIVDDEDSGPIQLPCATMNDFEEFNDLIRLNTEYRNKIKIKILKSINKRRSMTRCLGDIIRQFVSPNVGKLLVPVKATPGKKVFKNMTIYNLLEGIYTHSFGSNNKPVSTQKFIKAVQGVLHNAKDWNGGRKVKETNEKSDEEQTPEESNTDFQGSEGD